MSLPSSGSIIINKREVAISDIVSERAITSSEFEKDTFQFIKQWIEGKETFSFQSSGSTGLPKKIDIKRNQILASIKATATALALKPGEKALLCIPVANTGGKMMIARALEIGMDLECTEPSNNPLKNARKIPDFMAIVPLQLSAILDDRETLQKLNNCRNVLVGGAPVNNEIINKLKAVNCRVYATYGMTETVSHIALQLLNTSDKQSSFHILPGIEIDIDERACLKVKGAVTDNKWLQTNDHVRIIGIDQFQWLGRNDLVINSGGHKIQPEQVEKSLFNILTDLNLKRNFFVHGLPDERLGAKCTLFIEGDKFDEDTMNLLKQKIDFALAGYDKPRSIYFIKEFLKTGSGKLDRHGTAAKISY